MTPSKPHGFDLVLRRAQQGDGWGLLQLYQQGFRVYGAGRSGPDPTQQLFVAERDGHIFGFGSMVSKDQDPALTPLLNYLDPLIRKGFEPIDGSTPPVTVEAPPDFVVSLTEPGVVLTALTVAEGHRRQGIGTQLVRHRLSEALNQGAKQAWVHCVCGAGSRELYERLGFTALVTLARYYPRGQGMTLLHADEQGLRRAVFL